MDADILAAKGRLQQPVYPDRGALEQALGDLARLPPLVTSWEVENLKGQLAEACGGGGSCCKAGIARRASPIAPRADCQPAQDPAANELGVGARRQEARDPAGAASGQYAKPRQGTRRRGTGSPCRATEAT